MREIRQGAKGRAKVAQELADTDTTAEEEQFLAAARQTATSEEFDALIFGAEQIDREETEKTTIDSESDSKLPV